MTKTINRLKCVYLFVNNVKKSSIWYSKVLNVPLIMDGNNFAFLKIGPHKLCFHKTDKKSPVSTGGSVAYWHTKDLLKTLKLLVKNGAHIHRGPIKIPENNEGICQIKDPFGNVIGLQGKYILKGS